MAEAEKNLSSDISNNRSDDVIDFYSVLVSLWNKRKTLYKFIGVLFLFGILVSFASTVEYESTCKIMPELEDQSTGSLSSLSSLAGLAGISLSSGTSTILSPDVYPQIITSVPFQLNLINMPIRFLEADTLISPYNYFTTIYHPSIFEYLYKYTVQLPYQVKKLFMSDSIISGINGIYSKDTIVVLTRDDMELLSKFEDRLDISTDAKTGVITLTADMPDRFAAAQLAEASLNILENYVTNYKISKAAQNLDFIDKRTTEAKIRFLDAQEKLSKFNDANLNFNTATAKNKLQNLQNEFNLAFDLYKSLTQQLEQAQIEVKRQTPVFTILEPIKVPIEKSAPARKVIVILSLITGFFLGVIYLFLKDQIIILKRKIKESLSVI